jgi:hypothetical protein
MSNHQLLVPLLVAVDNSLRDTLVGLIPLFVFLIVLYVIMRRVQKSSPVAQLQKKYLEQQLEQMPRIEALLERIAKALERHQ